MRGPRERYPGSTNEFIALLRTELLERLDVVFTPRCLCDAYSHQTGPGPMEQAFGVGGIKRHVKGSVDAEPSTNTYNSFDNGVFPLCFLGVILSAHRLLTAGYASVDRTRNMVQRSDSPAPSDNSPPGERALRRLISSAFQLRSRTEVWTADENLRKCKGCSTITPPK